MTTIQFTVESPLPPPRIRDALTDFSGRRPTLWPNLDPRYYRVHEVGESWADVTEGSSFLGGVWEHDRYDWSEPNTVHISVVESNAFSAESFWQYRLYETENGGSHIAATVHRVGKTIKGRIVALLLGLFGRRIFTADFEKALARIASADSAPSDDRRPAQQSGTLLR
jgi:hypothetical protein